MLIKQGQAKSHSTLFQLLSVVVWLCNNGIMESCHKTSARKEDTLEHKTKNFQCMFSTEDRTYAISPVVLHA